MSHSMIAPSAPTVTPHVPSGATSRSFIWPGSASNCCRIRPSRRTAARSPSLPRSAARWGARGTRSTSPGRPSGPRAATCRPVSRSANATDLPGSRPARRLLPSSDSTALRSLSGPGATPCTPVSRRCRRRGRPRPPATSPLRVARAGDEQPGRRPSGSTTAPIGSPPTSAPRQHLADGAVGVDRAHPRPRLAGAGGEHHGVGRRRGSGPPALPVLVRLEDEARRVRRVDGPAEDLAGDARCRRRSSGRRRRGNRGAHRR